MKRWLLVLLLLLPAVPGWTAPRGETLQFGRFGQVVLYHQVPQPAHVVLFVSGDGGWNRGVIDMARSLAGLDALVVGIDINHYLRQLAGGRGKCLYPAADFEALSQYLQKKLGFPRYLPPVLVGYSSGATLVYAALAQAPPGTFRGAISLGFCPDLPLDKSFCVGAGLRSTAGPHGKGQLLLPASALAVPWIALQGTIDQVCNADDVQAFARDTGSAQLVLLPKVGHGFSMQRNWLPQFRAAFNRLVTADQFPPPATASLADLPLVEIAAGSEGDDTLAVIVSGDGGWASIDREVGAALAARGVPVVGLNALQYFWTPRNPTGMGRDLGRLLDHYLLAWGKKKARLIGYSLGADVLPFMANHLPPELRGRVSQVVLLNPGRRAAFEFHLSDWLGGDSEEETLPIRPQLEQLQGPEVLCVYGKQETDSLCREPGLANGRIKVIPLPGAHHYDGNFQDLATIILSTPGP
jgi:type IV secretory pathway VirJ component